MQWSLKRLVTEGPRGFIEKLSVKAKIEWLQKEIKRKSMDKRNTGRPREQKMY